MNWCDLLVRWCWQLDRAANRLTVWTGRLAAWATCRERDT
jgi:hypothetical protein